MSHNGKGKIWAGLAAGLAGGLAASFAMNGYQSLWNKVAGQDESKSKDPSDNPTVKTAAAVSKAFGHRLREDEKMTAGPLVHYIFGTAVGGAYGVAAELSSKACLAAGLPFGAAVWLGADGIALPRLRLTPPAAEAPVSTHVYALTSHLVYGAVADGVRRLVRKLWR